MTVAGGPCRGRGLGLGSRRRGWGGLMAMARGHYRTLRRRLGLARRCCGWSRMIAARVLHPTVRGVEPSDETGTEIISAGSCFGGSQGTRQEVCGSAIFMVASACAVVWCNLKSVCKRQQQIGRILVAESQCFLSCPYRPHFIYGSLQFARIYKQAPNTRMNHAIRGATLIQRTIQHVSSILSCHIDKLEHHMMGEVSNKN